LNPAPTISAKNVYTPAKKLCRRNRLQLLRTSEKPPAMGDFRSDPALAHLALKRLEPLARKSGYEKENFIG
jgi:hypothetical protein